MKKLSFLTVALLFSFALSLESCGPVVVTSRIGTPPPPWFYPNRAEIVRYVYFPEFEIYYDFSSRNYLYLENGIWITANILPSRYHYVNLRRSHHIRINNYFGDDIHRYHYDNRNNLNRSNTSRRNPAVNRNLNRRN